MNMAAHDILAGMQVLGSDGGLIGEVDGVSGERIKLKRAIGSGPHHFIPSEWVARVDDHVHLSLDAATARERWVAESDDGHGAYAAAPAAAAAGERKANRIPWIIGLVLLAIVLVIGVRSCGYAAADTDYSGNAADVNMAAADIDSMAGATASAVAAPLAQAEAWLAGTEGASRGFAFERLNFDTSSAAIREEDRAEIAQLNTLLQRYPMTAVEIVGFTDARGEGAANAALGQQRADAVKAALVQAGTAEARIRTRSGGESQPADTNATAGGQFENRRTEVVITR
jgi:outer membrane protein OmpA-like peptidoglycan-associated protein